MNAGSGRETAAGEVAKGAYDAKFESCRCAVSRELRLWDARNGACLKVLTGHVDTVLCFDLGYQEQGGMYILSGSDDHTARLWALDV